MRTPTAWSRNESRREDGGETTSGVARPVASRPPPMKPHLAEAAADRLARAADDAPMAEEEVLRVLARIARTGKPGDRLRAAELIGKQLGMFRDAGERDGAESFAEMVLAAQRKRELPAASEVVDLHAERLREDA